VRTPDDFAGPVNQEVGWPDVNRISVDCLALVDRDGKGDTVLLEDTSDALDVSGRILNDSGVNSEDDQTALFVFPTALPDRSWSQRRFSFGHPYCGLKQSPFILPEPNRDYLSGSSVDLVL
jgi:hypothetical protein